MQKFYQLCTRLVAFYSLQRRLSLVLLLFFLIPLTAIAQKDKYDIELIVECIEYVGNGKFKANFGYDNKGKKTIVVAEDQSVVVYNYGQAKKYAINTFEPGVHNNAFSQEFDKPDKCDWILTLPDGETKTKSSSVNSSHICVKESDIMPYINPYLKVEELIGAELTSLANQTETPESNYVF